MPKKLNVLLVEDSDDDAQLVQREFRNSAFDAHFTRVDTREALLAALGEREWDIVLTDYSMPHFNGMEALRLVREYLPELPVILVSGTMGEDVAVEAMRAGANDYLMKGNLKRLVPAVERELRDAAVRIERKQAEAALRESEANLNRAQAVAQTGSWYLDIPANELEWSAETHRLFGIPPGRPLTQGAFSACVHPDDSQRVLQAWNEALRGAPYDIEHRILVGNETKWVRERAELCFDAAGNALSAVGTVQDITERRQAEEKLHASEVRFRTFIDHATDAFFIHDDRGIVLDVNQQACESLGYSREELIGMSPLQFDAAIALASLKQLLARLATGEMVAFDTHHRRKDGSTFPVEIRFRSFWEGGLRFGVSLARDITRRERNEQHIRQLNRTYAVLSDINGLIVHEREPQAILDGACRIAVEQGGFRMAQFGMLDAATQIVKPAASAGVVEGYLDAVTIDLQDSTRNTGLTARAILSGEHQVCNDIEHDPAMAPWREAALQRGYRSAASFPLMIAGHAVGTFNLYASEMDLFDADELRLLDELTQDIAFALEGCERERERQRTLDQLRASDERFRELAENIEDVFWITDPPKRQMLYISPAYEKVWGCSCQSLYDQPGSWLDAVHPDDRERVRHAAATQQAAGTYDEEYRIIRPDGGLRWVRDQAFPVRNAAGQIERVVGVAQDITERRQAEEKLHASNERYARQSAALMALTRACALRQGNLTDLMREVARVAAQALEIERASIWRYEPNRQSIVCRELFQRSSQSHSEGAVLQAGDFPSCFRALEEADVIAAHDAHRDPRTLEFGETYLRPHGISSLLDAPIHVAGSVAGVFCAEHVGPARQWTTDEQTFAIAIANVVSLLLAEEEVRSLAAFPERNPNPVIQFAADGSIAYFNRAAQDVAQRVGAGRLASILPPATREIVAECLATGQPRLRLETRHGPRTLSWSFYPIADQHTVHCYVGDITERLQLEEQLRQSQKMEAIGQLAGGVAHDFNNILTGMIMQTELTGSVEDLPESVREGLQEIRASADRAANLTRQLLLFSRRQVMQSQDLDINEIVTSLAKMLQRIIGEDVRLQLHLHPAPLMTHADAGMLDQVLLNLAVNARDAMSSGGWLLIETTEEIVPEGQTGLPPDATPGRHVCLSVRDTGGGIPPEVLPHIFEPFFTTKEPGKGTGLGLATVFGIVKQHQGWLKVDSEPGRGTSFRVFLPASEVTPAALAQAAARSKPRGGTETILLVEDEAALRKLTRAILQRNGYKVIEASNGVEALELWQKQRGKVVLLLTDLVMPAGMSGHQLAQQLQADQPQLKVIYASGYSADVAGRELKLRSGENFLQKPFGPDVLLETVRRCLDGLPESPS